MQEKWDREEAARIDLMRDVYKNREEALYYKKAIEVADLGEKDSEKVTVRAQVAEFSEAEKRKELEEIMVQLEHLKNFNREINHTRMNCYGRSMSAMKTRGLIY
jgi:hypothetical protein